MVPLLAQRTEAVGKLLKLGRRLDHKLVVHYTEQLVAVRMREDWELRRVPELGHRRRQQVDHSCLDTPQ